MSGSIENSGYVLPASAPVYDEYTITNTRPTGGSIRQLIERGVTHHMVQATINAVGQQQGIPQEKKELIYDALGEKLATGTIDTRSEAIQLSQMVQDMIAKYTQEMVEEAGSGATTESKKGKGGNWLVALAKAMSAISGEHLGKMVEKAAEIGALEFKDGLSAEEQGKLASEMSQLTAEMQAHGQMYKLVQEATTTSIKTIGEALTSTARKQ